MKKFHLFIFLWLSSFFANAQLLVIKGTITDEQSQPVPFATVFVKGTTTGTSANANGVYNLKVHRGEQEIIFSAVGYKQLIKKIDVQQNTEWNPVLKSEVYQLKDVVVNSGGEDPAYAIIRKAIKRRKSYLKNVPAYTCEVYIKGVQRILKAPERFLGKDVGKVAREAGLDTNRTGIIYQSESQSRLSFLPPDGYHEEMISSKVAGNNRSFSFNRATDLIINFYQNLQDWDGLCNRPFVSPIADNAMFYYDYKLIGSFVENGEIINKIQLIPKRKYDPAYRGYLYIIEDSWRIHSVDFLMSKESNILLLDSLNINQQFIAVNRKDWMPSNIKFEFNGGVFGFRFSGYDIGVYSNYTLNPSLEAKNFKEVLKITKEVNQKDSTYWADARPIPLTDEERVNYVKKDSIARLRASKPYLDSLDKVNNHLKITHLFFGGYHPRDRFKREYFHIPGLLNSLSYNTVEGFVLDYGVSFLKNIDTINNRYFSWKGDLRYGFSNQLFSANTSAAIPVAKRQSLDLALGSDVVDLNDKGSLSVFGNSLNSLLYEINNRKLYQKKFGSAGIASRLAGGLTGDFGLSYSSDHWLPNTSSYAFRNDKNHDFTSNNPFTPALDYPLFPDYQNFNMRINLSYDFGNKYVTYPSGKYYLSSKWPVFHFNYTKAIPGVFGSDADYDFMSLGISKAGIKLGFYGSFSFSAEAGDFLNSETVFYPDYKHFRGNESLTFQPGKNQFLFLNYYLFSTRERYFEAHAEHNFSGFFTNKIPLIRKLKLQELLGANYLTTPTLNNYTEVYFGLSYIGIKGYYGLVFEGEKRVKSGFRIAYGF